MMNKYTIICIIMISLSIGSGYYTIDSLLNENADDVMIGIIGVFASCIIGSKSSQKAQEQEKRNEKLR